VNSEEEEHPLRWRNFTGKNPTPRLRIPKGRGWRGFCW